MQINFATSNPGTARQYLKRAMGEQAESCPQLVDRIVELVGEGKVRVGDPMMYNEQSPLYPTEQLTDEEKREIQDMYAAL